MYCRQTDRQDQEREQGQEWICRSVPINHQLLEYTCTCRKNENEIRIQARKPRAHHHPQRKHRRKGKKSERKGHFVPIMPTAQCKPHRTGTLQKTATIQRQCVPNTATSTIVSRGCAKKKNKKNGPFTSYRASDPTAQLLSTPTLSEYPPSPDIYLGAVPLTALVSISLKNRVEVKRNNYVLFIKTRSSRIAFPCPALPQGMI